MKAEPPLTIRQFRFPQDYEPVFALWAQAGPGVQLRLSDEPQEIAKKVQRDPDLFLLAENDGEVVGAVIGGYDGRRGMMYHLAVAEKMRRRGVATALVDELERRLREKGCVRYYLLVTQDNEGARAFYQARGWEVMDLIPMAKDLT